MLHCQKCMPNSATLLHCYSTLLKENAIVSLLLYATLSGETFAINLLFLILCQWRMHQSAFVLMLYLINPAFMWYTVCFLLCSTLSEENVSISMLFYVTLSKKKAKYSPFYQLHRLRTVQSDHVCVLYC